MGGEAVLPTTRAREQAKNWVMCWIFETVVHCEAMMMLIRTNIYQLKIGMD